MGDLAANVAQLLVAAGRPDASRGEAEKRLFALFGQPGLVDALLSLSAEGSTAMSVRMGAALLLKTYVTRCWDPDDAKRYGAEVHARDRAVFKGGVVGVMMSVEPLLQGALSATVAHVCRTDFPERWQELLPQLAERLAGGDLPQIKIALRTANAIFERYGHDMRSDALFTEIKYAIGVFGQPLLALFERCMQLAFAQDAGRDQLVPVFSLLAEVCDAFYSLNWQDLPEFFEDTMPRWWDPFRRLLAHTDPRLASADPDEPGPLELVKTSVCRIATLYAGKYDEDFRDKHLAAPFVEVVWGVLTSLGEEQRYDGLVAAAVRFLSTVAEQPWNRELFANPEALQQMCERVIIPQLKLRESDVELFSDDPVEYIRRDVEGSDVDTRRRITADFVRALCVHFEEHVTGLLKRYVGVLLEQYAANPATNWIAKDAAMFVVLSLAVQGGTSRGGVSRVNPYVNVHEFLGAHVLTELERDINELPVLKADCLKFVAVFRSQLPQAAAAKVFSLAARHLESRDFVVHTYAARAVDRLLVTRLPASQQPAGQAKTGAAAPMLVPREVLAPQLAQVLEALFKLLGTDDSAENEYVIRAVLRVCAAGGEATAPLVGTVIKSVTAHILRVTANPVNPRFNHFLFETLACLVKNICTASPDSVAAFEGALFPAFDGILKSETGADFHPYVFQIMAQLLHFNTVRDAAAGRPASVPDVYKGLWPSFLSASLWLNYGNVPALVDLFGVYLRIGGDFISDKLQPVLGIFQQLLGVRRLDHCGMDLLTSVVTNVPLAKLDPVLPTVFGMLMGRLQNGKTPKYVRNLVVFLCNFAAKHGLAALQRYADAVQPGVLVMLVERVWVPAVDTVAYDERALVAHVMTTMLCDAPEMLQPVERVWPAVLVAVVRLFEAAQEDVGGGGEQDMIELAQSGSTSSYNPLAFTSLPPVAAADVPSDPETQLAVRLQRLFAAHPGKFEALVGATDAKVQAAISGYAREAAAGVHDQNRR